jgi:hypothetical protein
MSQIGLKPVPSTVASAAIGQKGMGVRFNIKVSVRVCLEVLVAGINPDAARTSACATAGCEKYQAPALALLAPRSILDSSFSRCVLVKVNSVPSCRMTR